MYKFEKLKVWRESLSLLEFVYTICKRLPDNEKNNLIDQIRRSATSVCLNIAEGTGSENDKEFSRYLNIAKKSLFEVIAIVNIINRLYKIDVIQILNQVELVSKLLSGLQKYLKTSRSKSLSANNKGLTTKD